MVADRKLRNKLTRVISKSGLSWVVYSGIVDYSEKLPGGHKTAVWMFDPVSKKEKILFHKDFLANMPVPLLVLVLRHEFLHKAMYRNIKGATNLLLLNYALDSAINKILFLSSAKGMVRLGNILFPANSERTDLTCLLNPSIMTAERNKIDRRLQSIFDEIYLTKKKEHSTTANGNIMTLEVDTTCADVVGSPYLFNRFIPDPLTLYNKMSSLLSPEQKKQIEKMYDWVNQGGRGGNQKDKKENQQNQNNGNNGDDNKEDDNELPTGEPDKDEATKEPEEKNVPEGMVEPAGVSDEDLDKMMSRGGKDNQRANDKKTIDAEKGSITGIKQDSWSCYVDTRAYFDKYVYKPKDAEQDGLNDFISKWQTEKQIECAINSIYNEIRNRTTLDPIPIELTRTGMELVVLDVCGPDQVPLYFNENKQGAKKKICCYFDTSPSMTSFVPYMVDIANFFNSCEECEISGGTYNGKYCFSEKVEGISDWDEFIKGKIIGGCGTSFEIVTKHATKMISEDEVDIIVVFTDGLSGINAKTIEEFNRTNKKCYTIYFSDPKQDYNYWHPRKDDDKTTRQQMHSDLDKLNPCETFTIFADTSQKEEV